MKTFLTIILITFSFTLKALEYSKIEFEGCPENAFCKKETGANRKKWLENLRNFSKNKITEGQINNFIQAEYGVPVSGWAREESSLLPNILLWDSPCRQHKNSANKFYISEVFRKNLNRNELKELPTLFFSRALVILDPKNIFTVIVPRGDAPAFIKDGSLYYLREEEGLFYGLLIDKNGRIKITKNETSPNLPKETDCPKDLIPQFTREAPGPNFYQGNYCKEVWDKTSKSYKTILLGWSCN